MPELFTPGSACLWLDDHKYSSQLLANNAPPLLSVADYVAFRRQAVSLLATDVVPIALAQISTAWVDEHSELVTKMAAKSRAVAPLRALLADEPLRAHLAATVSALRQAFMEQPLVITLPSPRSWIAITRQTAGVEEISIGQSEVDKASVYVAEFLRTFADCDLDGVLLTEDEHNTPQSADEIAWYQPVLNVASHFRWKIGVSFPVEDLPKDLSDGLDFVVAHSSCGALPSFLVQPSAVWMGESVGGNSFGQYVYAEIPQDAQPEKVLAVINDLREGRGA